MTVRMRLAMRWLWISTGLIRALVTGMVPAAEARQMAAIEASASAEPHIEETSRPECAPPHQDGCALCAHAFAIAEPSPATPLAPRARTVACPGGAVRQVIRAIEAAPRPRSPPVA